MNFFALKWRTDIFFPVVLQKSMNLFNGHNLKGYLESTLHPGFLESLRFVIRISESVQQSGQGSLLMKVSHHVPKQLHEPMKRVA